MLRQPGPWIKFKVKFPSSSESVPGRRHRDGHRDSHHDHVHGGQIVRVPAGARPGDAMTGLPRRTLALNSAESALSSRG
jgi:hypothetical protein